jgi:hypothetical protein
MSVRRRRERILALVASSELSTQEELVEALRRDGIEASQASVSRDIAALGLVKAGGRYAARPAVRPARNPRGTGARVPDHDGPGRRSPVGSRPRRSSALGYAIDGLDLPGWSARCGDDIAVRRARRARAIAAVQRRLRAIQAGSAAGGR